MRPLALVLLSVALTGCSGSVSVGGSSISGEEIAKNIRPEYVAQTKLELREFSCEGTDGEEGSAISCKGVNERDVQIDIAGTVTGTEGSKANFRWKVVRALAPGSLFEQGALEALGKASAKPLVSMTCPERIDVKAGAKVTCTASAADGDEAPVELTLTDGDGAFRARFVN